MEKRTWNFMLAALILGCVAPLWPQDAVDRDGPKIQDFEKRIDDYMKARKSALAPLARPKQTESADAISKHEHEVAEHLRQARPQAKQGDIFTPEITGEFRRLVGIASKGAGATRIDKSLKRAEPVPVQVRINDAYPTAVPLQSTPPSLILSLPMLPPELDYRVAGHDLVLRDVEGNLVIDFIPGLIP